MTNLVQFPGLGLSFELNRVAFSIGGFSIYWYGVCIALGICLALVFAFRHSVEFGVDADSMVDVILIGIVMGIISARAYYVAMAPFKYESIWEMIAIRDGGLAIYGGIIGGFLFGGLACKWRKVPVLPMFDLASMGFLIGQCIGRWGNFVNQEAFGTNTTLPWGMISENTTAYLSSVQATLAAQGITVDPNLPVHPTFLYESLWCLVGFLLLAAYEKHRRFHGEVMLMYVMWYGLGRFFIEGLRTDSLMVGPFRISQVVAAASTLAALALWLVLRKKYAGVPLMVTYTAVEKGKDGPLAYSVSWPAGQTPSAAQLKEQLAAARARLQQAGAGETVPNEAGPAPAAPEEAPGQKAAQAEPEEAPGHEARQAEAAKEAPQAEPEDGKTPQAVAGAAEPAEEAPKSEAGPAEQAEEEAQKPGACEHTQQP